MVYMGLIDFENKTILYPYQFEDSDTFEAGERYRALDVQKELHLRDDGKEYGIFRGAKPYEFLPASNEELAEALAKAED